MKSEHKEIFLPVMRQTVKEFFEGEGLNGFYSKENKSVAYFNVPEIKRTYRKLNGGGSLSEENT